MSDTAKTLSPSQQIARDRKRDPVEQAKFMARMLRSTARRSAEEDPENGLAVLIEVRTLLADLIDDTTMDLIDQIGPKLVGEGIGLSKQAMNNRYGPSSKARARVQARRDAKAAK